MWNNTRIGYIASRGTRTQFYFVLWRIKFCSTRFNEDVYAVYKYIYIHHMHERYYASSSLFTVCNYPHNANILKIGHCRDSISPNEIIATRDRTFARYIISSPDLQDYLENLDMDIKIIRKKEEKKCRIQKKNLKSIELPKRCLYYLRSSIFKPLSPNFSFFILFQIPYIFHRWLQQNLNLSRENREYRDPFSNLWLLSVSRFCRSIPREERTWKWDLQSICIVLNPIQISFRIKL